MCSSTRSRMTRRTESRVACDKHIRSLSRYKFVHTHTHTNVFTSCCRRRCTLILLCILYTYRFIYRLIVYIYIRTLLIHVMWCVPSLIMRNFTYTVYRSDAASVTQTKENGRTRGSIDRCCSAAARSTHWIKLMTMILKFHTSFPGRSPRRSGRPQ